MMKSHETGELLETSNCTKKTVLFGEGQEQILKTQEETKALVFRKKLKCLYYNGKF